VSITNRYHAHINSGGTLGTRFRKSFKIAPGVRLNASLTGLSATLGPRGASLGVSSRGVYSNLGIPGSGISHRSRISGPARRPTSRELDREMNEQLRQQAQVEATAINDEIDRVLRVHASTPDPFSPVGYSRDLAPPEPARPEFKSVWFLPRLIRPWRESIERQNLEVDARYRQAFTKWEEQKAAHDEHEHRKHWLYTEGRLTDPEAKQDLLCSRLSEFKWPRETAVSLQIEDAGRVLLMDVDLPEIEDMPRDEARLGRGAGSVSVKTLSESRVRKIYMEHIHAVGFRLTGEARNPSTAGNSLRGHLGFLRRCSIPLSLRRVPW
jgi:hypothetical protein